MTGDPSNRRHANGLSRVVVALALMGIVLGAVLLPLRSERNAGSAKASDAPAVRGGLFRPTEQQWAALSIEPVELHVFRTEYLTEGKIAVDEDRSTPIFSPYAGRVTKLLVRPGDPVERGQPLFVVEASDSVQAQTDFIAAVAGVNKARAQVHLTGTTERRLHNLYDVQAMPLKDWQEAQANLTAAQNDLRSTEVALEAVRNRLRLLGKNDKEIDTFQNTGLITPDSTIYAPLSGTIVQRKVGPGQYITAGSSDPVFVIGDLSTVWLVAFVREADAPKARVGQTLKFTVLAHADRVFEAKVSYVSTAIDPNSRRLMVRATIDNSEGVLKPEMFASVTIEGCETGPSVAVLRQAVVYEGDVARVWVVRDDRAVELRRIKTGLTNGSKVQVLEGLTPGEKLITKGSLFIDRAATLGG